MPLCSPRVFLVVDRLRYGNITTSGYALATAFRRSSTYLDLTAATFPQERLASPPVLLYHTPLGYLSREKCPLRKIYER